MAVAAEATTTDTAPAEFFRLIPLDQLVESKTNPRQHWNKKKQDELTQSIKQQGVVQPIVVRPHPISGSFLAEGAIIYEIVAGARRFRGSKAAKRDTIPAVVRALTDVQVLEIQTIENLQRDDIHELDEALGYQRLMEEAGYDVPAIATKVGKSTSYIYQRLKLTALIEAAQKAFFEEKIDAGHAILIARLQPQEQKEALKVCDNKHRHVSVRELATWIDNNVHLDLHSAPFKKDDAELLPAAGACAKCPKRTGFQPELFPDIKKKDTCTDPTCFKAKNAAHVQQEKALLAQKSGLEVVTISPYAYQPYGEEETKDALRSDQYTPVNNGKRCEHTKLGLFVDTHRQGDTTEICTDPKCSVHRASEKREERSTTRADKAQQAAVMQGKARAAARDTAITTLLGKVRRLTAADLRVVAIAFAQEMWHEHFKELCRAHDWASKKNRAGGHDWMAGFRPAVATMDERALHRLLLEFVLRGRLLEHGIGASGAAPVRDLLKRYRVDLAKIERDALAAMRAAKEAKAKAKRKPTVQTSAKSQASNPRKGKLQTSAKAGPKAKTKAKPTQRGKTQ